MKKIALLLTFLSFQTFAQLPCSVPAKSTLVGAEKFMICDAGLSKNVPFSLIKAKVIDSLKQAMGGTYGLLAFDGVRWRGLDTTTFMRTGEGGTSDTSKILTTNVKYAESITKGQAVYVSGGSGTNILVSKADNTTESTSSKTLGLVLASGATNFQGKVITDGILDGLNTNTATIGDPVWLGTSGNLIYGLTNKPVAPAHLVYIGVVTRVSATVGEIFIKVQNGFELNEIHNVLLTSLANNDVLTYESSTGLWKNKQVSLTNITLNDGQIPIGDGTNKAFGRTLSGDVTISNTGVTTITNAAVTNTKIANSTIDLTTKVKGLLPDSNIASASTWNAKQSAFGTQTQGYVVAASPTTSSTVSGQYLRRGHLKNIEEPIGQFISDDYSVDYLSTRYTRVGSNIWTVGSGKLTSTGGSTKTLGDYIGYSFFGNIGSKKIQLSTEITTGTATSTSFGRALGIQGSALSIQGALLLNSANNGQLAFYFNNSTSTEDLSTNAISYTAGDVIRLVYTIDGTAHTLTATNISVSTYPSITHTKEIINNNNNTYRLPNSGFATQYSLGGTFSSDNFSVKSNANKYPKLLIIGDSKAVATRSVNIAQGWGEQLAQKINGQVEILAGGGDLISNANPAEVALYSADNVIIDLGVNDLIAGTAASTVDANLASLVTNIGYTVGTNCWVCNMIPCNSVNVVPLNALLATRWGDNVIKLYSTFANNGLSTIQTAFSPDGTHLNSEGNLKRAEITYAFGLEKGIWTSGTSVERNNNAVYQIGGKTPLGNYNHIPNFTCDIYNSTNAQQFRIGSTINTIEGLTMWSASAGHAVLSGGMYVAESTGSITSSHTANNRLSLLNGDIKISSDVGATIGSAITPTDRLRYTNSTNVWETINSNVIFAGTNTSTSGTTTYRRTNAGSDEVGMVKFENGNSNVTNGTALVVTPAGGFGYLKYNGTRHILRGTFGFATTNDNPGSEDGYLTLNPQASGSSVAAMCSFRSNGVYLGNGTTAPTEMLHVGGNLKVNHIIGNTSTPSISAGAGSGTSPTVSISGTDLGGYVTITTGTSPSTSAVVATVTFNVAFGAAPKCIILSGADVNGTSLGNTSKPYVPQSAITTTSFTINSLAIGLNASTTYMFYYQVIQ